MQVFSTAAYADFDVAMAEFLDSNELAGIQIQAAALAVAGAVEDNRVHMTNCSWVIDGYMLKRQFNFRLVDACCKCCQ